MTFLTELTSWLPLFTGPTVSSEPKSGEPAPSHSKLTLPLTPGKPAIITFLRHCGCPYAEKTFLQLRTLASKHPEIDFIAVSHSDEAATKKWLKDVGGAKAEGSQREVRIVVDAEREIYAKWGLGATGFFHVLNSASLGGVSKLGSEEGIKIRDTESGSRWQKAGSFGVDGKGFVRWVSVATSAEKIGDFEEGIRKVEEGGK